MAMLGPAFTKNFPRYPKPLSMRPGTPRVDLLEESKPYFTELLLLLTLDAYPAMISCLIEVASS
jgi:hypothetical protein